MLNAAPSLANFQVRVVVVGSRATSLPVDGSIPRRLSDLQVKVSPIARVVGVFNIFEFLKYNDSNKSATVAVSGKDD
jgi:hypothetical protein